MEITEKVERIRAAIKEAAEIALGNNISIDDLASGIIDKFHENGRNKAQELFEVSEIDLKVAEILFKENLFAPAIYHFQQSIEKVTKAYFLWTGFIKEDELYGNKGKRTPTIGHITPRAFIILLRKTGIKNYISSLKTQGDNGLTNKSFSDIDTQINELEKLFERKLELAKLKKMQILELIESFSRFDLIIRKIDKRKLKASIKKFETGVIFRLEKILTSQEIAEIRKVLSEKVDGLIDPENIFTNSKEIVLLYLLSIITYPHEEYSRYPNNRLSPNEYTQDLGIVESFPRMIEISHPIFAHLRLLLVATNK